MNSRTLNTNITNVRFKNNHVVYENFIKCTIKDYEFNLSYNPTLLSGSQAVLFPFADSGSVFYNITGSRYFGILKDFVTGSISGSEFSPYITTVGLYNDSQELLAIAKMSAPIPISSNSDMTFLIKYDTQWIPKPYFTPTPTPSVSPFPSPSVSITPTVTPSVSRTPSVTPSITPSISITPTSTPSISVTPTATPDISVTPSVSITPSISVTPSPTPSCGCLAYIVTIDDGTPNRNTYTLSWTNCSGTPVSRATVNTRSYTVCTNDENSIDGEFIDSVVPDGCCSSPTVFTYAGTTNNYATSTLACNNKTCGRPWYRDAPTWANGQIVYNDSSLTTPYNGGGNWIAVDTASTFCTGTGWRAIQVDIDGTILNSVACP